MMSSSKEVFWRPDEEPVSVCPSQTSLSSPSLTGSIRCSSGSAKGNVLAATVTRWAKRPPPGSVPAVCFLWYS